MKVVARRCDVCGSPIRLAPGVALAVAARYPVCPECVGWATRAIRAAIERAVNR